MRLTPAAEQRLKTLLPQEATGYSVLGYVGTCRGSTPILEPAQSAAPGQQTITDAGVTFFVNEDIADVFRDCEMNYDPSLFGKGLHAVWPHREGCACENG